MSLTKKISEFFESKDKKDARKRIKLWYETALSHAQNGNNWGSIQSCISIINQYSLDYQINISSEDIDNVKVTYLKNTKVHDEHYENLSKEMITYNKVDEPSLKN